MIYLAVEINQNTEALHPQSRQSILESAQSELFLYIDRTEMVGYVVGREPLTADQNLELHTFLVAAIRVRQFSWLQYRSGTIDETKWSTELNVFEIVLSTDRTRTWWHTMGRPAFGQEFRDFVDSAFEDHPIRNETWASMRTWTDRPNQ